MGAWKNRGTKTPHIMRRYTIHAYCRDCPTTWDENAEAGPVEIEKMRKAAWAHSKFNNHQVQFSKFEQTRFTHAR